jgi:hypothetical protein
MKAIRLIKDASSQEKIMDYLKVVNGRASAHCTTVDSIFSDISEIEKSLYSVLGAKKHWKGVEAISYSGTKLPNAYRFSRMINTVHLQYDGKYWNVVDIKKKKEYGNASVGKHSLIFSHCHEDAAMRHLKQKYNLKNEKAVH